MNVVHNDLHAVRLCEARCGDDLIISCIESGQNLKNRFIDMGIIPGAKVKLNISNKNGPVVLTINGSRLMLGHGMAEKIFVKKE